MIDVSYWPTPNGHKVTIFLEETGLEYRLLPVNITKGEQFHPDYLRISPNNKMPAIVDTAPPDGGPPLALFESGAILEYLAVKAGRFLPTELRARANVMQWLFWQMAGLGPMLGQNHHFALYAPEKIPYAIERYVKETARLYRVLDTQLSGRDYVAETYSIADMACHPWIAGHARQGQKLEDFPNVKRWFESVAARPAVQRAYALGPVVSASPMVLTEEARRALFHQVAPAAATR
ncbi:MAG: glutathione binding-like protein [Myxococcaceae bacterium]